MNSKAPRSRSDDIVQLKDRLGLEDLPYQDLTRVIELGRACRRWPLLGETVAQLGVAPPAAMQSGQALPGMTQSDMGQSGMSQSAQSGTSQHEGLQPDPSSLSYPHPGASPL